MRCRAAEVEARDVGPRRQPVLPHLAGHDVTLEDVAAGEADARLDVRRPEHLEVLEAVLEVGGEASDEFDELAADLVPARVPGPLGQVVRRVLAEDTHEVLAGRGGRWIAARLDVGPAEADRRLARPRALEVALGVLEAGGDVDARPGRERLARG